MALPKMTANYFVGFSHSNSCRYSISFERHISPTKFTACRTLLASVILRYSHCKIAYQLFFLDPFSDVACRRSFSSGHRRAVVA